MHTEKIFKVSTFAAQIALLASGACAADLFNNTNPDGVFNGGKEPSFQLVAEAHVTQLDTYHWNNQQGAKPGTIALRSASGQLYGPFPATGTTGALNTPNANWVAVVNLNLPPGTYTVVDSDPATWSYNYESKLNGFAIVSGDYEDVEPVPGPGNCVANGTPQILYSNSNIFAVNNNPLGRTAFVLTRPACITQVDDYHFNFGGGASPAGTISLELQNGRSLLTFGPFRAQATNGAAANVNWVAAVNQILPAGAYFVNDSQPSTWSQNVESGYRGFTTIWGTYVNSSQPANPGPVRVAGPGGAPVPVSCPALLGTNFHIALRANPTTGPAPLTVTFTLCQNISASSPVTGWTLGSTSIPGSAQISGSGPPPPTVTVTYTGPGTSSPTFCVNAGPATQCASLPSPIVIR